MLFLLFFLNFLLEKNMKNVKKFLNFSWFFFSKFLFLTILYLWKKTFYFLKFLCLNEWWSLMIFCLLVKKDTISESRNLSNAVNANSLLGIFLSGLFSWNILYLNRRSEIWNWRPHRKWGIFELIDTGMIRCFFGA